MKKYFFKFKIRFALVDLKGIFPMKPSEFEISYSVDRYDKKKLLKIGKNFKSP